MNLIEIPIYFFSEDIDFELPDPTHIQQWILETIQSEKHTLLELNYIFCSDAYLHQINLEYLAHDTFTDIITFDNSEEDGQIEGDIFISIERVKENAQIFQTGFDNELKRVIIHGVLHLLGYGDKTPQEAQIMREMEDVYLAKG